MKRRGLGIFTGATLVFCSILLTACGDAEWDLIGEFFMVWAEENGYVVENEIKWDAIVAKAGKNVIDNILNTDENVQLEGLDVIRDIERSESAAAEALEKQDPGLMELPKEIRPNDWVVHEKDAVVWGAANNGAAAQSAFSESDALLKKRLEQGGSCLAARREQLETRLELVWDEIMLIEGGPGREKTALELRDIHEQTRLELKAINHRQYSQFCSGK